MADWNSPLPDVAEVGDENHVEDHNAIVAAIGEVRSNVDAVEVELAGKQSSGDYATADDLATLAARVQALEEASPEV